MTVIIKIGRRVPRTWFRRTASRVKGLMTFQENIWLIIDRAMTMAKKACTKTPNGGCFDKRTFRDTEDINFDLEWIQMIYQGNPDQEEEEYNELGGFYKSLGSYFKKDLPIDENFRKAFKTARVSDDQLKKMYSAGTSDLKNRTIAQKLLDMGIMIHVEKIDDFNIRDKKIEV